jgi:protein-disulfide isomerase
MTKSTRSGQKGKSNHIGLWIVGISALVVIGVIALAAFNSRPAKIEVTAPDVPAAWIARSTIGNPEAAVTVQAFEDFLCPHCLEWTDTVETKLLADYVKPGLVKFTFQPFPLGGFMPGSLYAALAAECAADQGKFWEYHDRLFQAQREGQAGFEVDRLVQYASDLGLDSNALLQCVSSQQHLSEVQASQQQGDALNIGGTPSIFVNGKQVEATYAALKAEIDAQLAATGSSN